METRLILMRHAKSDWDTGAPDFERPLNERGRLNAAVASEYMQGIEVDLALVSSSARTQETWQRLQLDAPMLTEATLYHASSDSIMTTVAHAVAGVDSEPTSVLVVAHNPGCADLVERLLESVPDGIDRFELDRYPTAAIAVIDLPGGWAALADGTAVGTGSLVDFKVPR